MLDVKYSFAIPIGTNLFAIEIDLDNAPSLSGIDNAKGIRIIYLECRCIA